MKGEKFNDIRPYYNEEIPLAMQRIAADPAFPLLASYVYPSEDINKVRERIRTYCTIRDFQLEVMRCVNEQVIARSTSGFTYEGLDKLSPKKKYLFVSNHRDIMLDACLLQYALYQEGHETSEITFGANLMQGQLVTDIGKSNKMFRVERPGMSPREFYKCSLHLSEYIRYVITQKGESVWIAQRNGRTKDGLDRTDQGIIKMFGLGFSGDKIDALADLNIVPVSISYEWEPCDYLKALELYHSCFSKYVKKPGEDINSILTGIMQPKGKVHIEFCDLITKDDLKEFEAFPLGEYNRRVAGLVDNRICTSYRLTPNNYIAHDIKFGNNKYVDFYSEQEKLIFEDHIKKIREYKDICDITQLTDIILGIYSNPIESKEEFSIKSN